VSHAKRAGTGDADPLLLLKPANTSADSTRTIADQAAEYDGIDDFARSLDAGYRAIRERVAAGGAKWVSR
jgi:hypothetical protein